MNKHAILAILVVLLSLPLICTPSAVYANNKLNTVKDSCQINCGEDFSFYFWQVVPSLSIEEIECSPDNKLSVTVVLKPAEVPGGPWEDVWEAEGKVYFDDDEIGVFDIRNPTYPEGGVDSYSYGRYTYLLPWEITTPVTVRILVRATATIEENDATYYPVQDTSREELVEPLNSTPLKPIPNTSNKTVMYLPLLLGLIGLSLVLWIGYRRYGTRLFHARLLFRRKLKPHN